LIANYNATPHSGLGYRSPREQLERLLAEGAWTPRQADPDAVRRMIGVRKLCTLLAGIKSGRRRHFNFGNARYATVSTPQRQFLGVVRAAPPWHRTPHSLYVRQTIRAHEKRRLLHLATNGDAVDALPKQHRRANCRPIQRIWKPDASCNNMRSVWQVNPW
jgi:hypothetical protein